jgi:glutamate-1-semialdehyde 2,1-aminomutase
MTADHASPDTASPGEATSRYSAHTPRSQAHYARARSIMPGGVAKGAFFQQPYPLYLASGEGCYVTSLDGQQLLDFRGHHTAAILGHRHPAVLAAIQAQVEHGIALGGPTEVEYELALELTRRVPSLERIRFTSSGSEAMLHVLRLVRGWTGHPKIAKFEGAYHGSADAVEVSVSPPLNLAGPAAAPHTVPSVKGIDTSAITNTVILPYNQPEAVARLLARHRQELAAVLLDPRAGILPIDLDFIRYLRQITHELGLLLVMDEVVAFRLGTGGLQGLCEVRPDLTIFGKVIGGGFPIGAFGGRADVMDLLDATQGATGFFQSGTFSGHPVALAAGLATLRVLTPEIYGHLNQLGEAIRQQANALFARLGLTAQAVGNGSLFGIHFTAQPLRDYRALRTADAAKAHDLVLRCIGEGALAAPGFVMNAVSVPMDQSHVAKLITALDHALRA